jgi:hypothetical protein
MSAIKGWVQSSDDNRASPRLAERDREVRGERHITVTNSSVEFSS